MRFTIEIHADEGPLVGSDASVEIARLLRDSAAEIEGNYGTGDGYADDSARLFDAAGSIVGHWTLEANA